MEIVSIDGDTAVCVLDDISINASISLVPEAMVGDYAIVHAGFAIEILNEDEARETMKLFDDIEESYRESLEADPAD
jgi:hydrogenase expression/formation protein HypC